MTDALQQSVHLRFGAGFSAGGVVELWLFHSLPTVVAAAVHRAASRGRHSPHRDARHSSSVRTDASVAAGGAGGQGCRGIRRDDGCPGRAGGRQRGADVMVMLG